ncbi:MAG: ParB/RepB/Spo0J family partition protein [Bacteroidales bacterium]|nr:ParB/RepB/Spo0J family partition protein [Bacteroidales bacterium]
MAKKQSGLGRGLGALIEDAKPTKEVLKGVDEIAVSAIKPNPYQPRTVFNQEALEELAASIAQIGVIQPITVRALQDGTGYELISGERRWRASKMAGLETIPAYVREANTQGMLEMAIIENIQREDLDPMEVAISFQQLLDECQLTQESLSERVGKKRATVTNYLRLLKLPPEIQIGIREKKLSMGHAKAIMGIDDEPTQLMIFEQVLKYDFSVRKTEDIVRQLKEGHIEKPAVATKKAKTPVEYESLKAHLGRFFNAKVDLKVQEEGQGKIVIPFVSSEDLERIIAIFDQLEK